MWDTVAEAGQCRLSGHKGIVTQVKFMRDYNILISSSKDTFIKLWDLETKRCFKTLTGYRTEVVYIHELYIVCLNGFTIN